jgi:hypothetical protein
MNIFTADDRTMGKLTQVKAKGGAVRLGVVLNGLVDDVSLSGRLDLAFPLQSCSFEGIVEFLQSIDVTFSAHMENKLRKACQ